MAAVILDLDGVVVSTDELHFQAWKEIADRLGIPFDRRTNDRLRGVSRMESLDLLLGPRTAEFDLPSRQQLADAKNRRYRELLQDLSPADVLPGVHGLLTTLRARGVPVAIGSSSRNCRSILRKIGLSDAFDAVVDGERITRSKPDPEVFLLAAADLGVDPANCLVVEDAESGISAAIAAGMCVAGVGGAADDVRVDIRAADVAALAPTIVALASEARP